MTLCDAGPLFALVDPRQTHAHERCRLALPMLGGPLITTWPSFAEAMSLAGRAGGWPMQRRLWRYVETDVLSIHAPSVGEVERMFALMDEYRDTPMDLADASLVAAAESLGISRIFTLDHHFRIYRLRGTQALEVVP